VAGRPISAKATHEAIRHRTHFETIVQNVERFLALRDERAASGRPATRVLVRMILQDSNRHEWDDYQAFWRASEVWIKPVWKVASVVLITPFVCNRLRRVDACPTVADVSVSAWR
jgi:hypothetical protein